eukprot:TRINITY_DN31943_c0_g1_i1.p1 TRINITY_DN31943_c0_g1~~TRINITY_DN31943_c0_g1_i1.p1  ORF type:complete len:761 (+),score=158.82 TRINITY_DN31943_c0_g1_i1:126-2408(+)
MGDDLEPEDAENIDGDAAAKKKKARKKKKKVKESDEPFENEAQEPQQEAPAVSDAPTWQPAPEELGSHEPQEWVDVTELANLAVQGMKVGEMIESCHFRLYDAMSAIEIMDPKMDSGFNNSQDMTLAKAEETGVVSTNLSNEELVVIMDELLMYYLLWLDGHTVVQTCFSCLYLQEPERLLKKMPAFGSFVDAFLVACRFAWETVTRAGVFDDEDFLPTMFGVNLEACVFSSDANEIYKLLEAEREKLKKSESPNSQALAFRLEFIGEYMLALAQLLPTLLNPDQKASGNKSGGKGQRAKAIACWNKALKLLDRLEKSVVSSSPEMLRCFDASINRKLLVPGPPRTVQPIKDPKIVFGMWNSHVQELLLCTGIQQRQLAVLLQGSITYKGQPSILPRSVAQLCAAEQGLARRLLLESLEQFLFPPEAVQHCKKPVETFLTRCEAMVLHLLKLSHSNNARRFRRLAHVFPDFNELQHEAWQLDEVLKVTFGANLRHPRPCWIWIMEHCLQSMIAKLLLGFQLELYDEAEFHMIYWYVDYLYGLRIYNLNELCHAKEQDSAGNKKKPGKKDQPGVHRNGQKPKNPPPYLLLLEATQTTVRGIFRLLAFCLSHGLLPAPPASEAGLPQRFVLRFRCLEEFRLPHLPSYADFDSSSAAAQVGVDGRAVLKASQSSFQEATVLLDRMTAVSKDGDSGKAVVGPGPGTESPAEAGKSLKRVLVANQLAAMQLLKALEEGKDMSEKKVSVENSHHPSLVSLQVPAMK